MSNYIIHSGTKGMRWGVKNGPPYPIGVHHGTYNSSDVVFVSGKVKFDEPIPEAVKTELDLAMNANSKIIIGDAPGADTRCQKYLAEQNYDNVEVYTTDSKVRNNVGNWKVIKISSDGLQEERDIRAQKDIAMTNAATKGIAISSFDDRPDSATSNNIKRMLSVGKNMQFYDYKKNTMASRRSNFIEHLGYRITYNGELECAKKSESITDSKYIYMNMSDCLSHHGIIGQKWGKQNGPPYPLSNEISTGSKLKMTAAERRLERQDKRWGEKQDRTTKKKLQRAIQNTKQMKEYDKQLRQYYQVRNKDGSLNKNYIAAYNQKLAEYMNQYVDAIEDLRSPSGMVLSFVAQRGEIGVATAMRTSNYDISKFKRGITKDGKIAYRDEYVDRYEYDNKRRK